MFQATYTQIIQRFGRTAYLVMGLFFLAVGIVGAVLPLLPSTCFFIIAAYYFGLSSARLENLLLNHPRIGPVILSWRNYRAIPKLGKVMACVGMSISGFILVASPAPQFVKLGVIAVLGLSAWYVLSRPNLEDLVQSSTSKY